MCLAVPGLIVNLIPDNGPFAVGSVEFAGVRRSVNLACVPEAKLGDYVLVHAGVAIAVINEEEAEKLLRELTAIDPLNEFVDGPGDSVATPMEHGPSSP